MFYRQGCLVRNKTFGHGRTDFHKGNIFAKITKFLLEELVHFYMLPNVIFKLFIRKDPRKLQSKFNQHCVLDCPVSYPIYGLRQSSELKIRLKKLEIEGTNRKSEEFKSHTVC